ncbi:hypothetical protein BDZ89DRAFT_1085808 [Hymenopellis radicata]|nr:hypothetical protein BDZ89DRAFT_1085808 [Hymenopellis radicata]
MSTALDSFPDLPTTAVHDRNDACRLVLVSKTVHIWIEPLIYHSIVVDSRSAASRLARAFRLRDCNARTFITRFVKQLCVYYHRLDDEADDDLSCLLDMAIDAVSIVWWCKTTALLPYIDRLRPEYFSFADLTLKTVDTLLPRSITHLNVIFHAHYLSVAEHLSAQSYESLWRDVFERCPFLSHIMIGFYLSNPPPWASHKITFIQSVLSTAPPTFKALIIELKTSAGPTLESPLGWNVSDFGASLDDPRFIIVGPERWLSDVKGVACYQTGPDWDYWVYARGRDIWEFADAQLRARASKTTGDAFEERTYGSL